MANSLVDRLVGVQSWTSIVALATAIGFVTDAIRTIVSLAIGTLGPRTRGEEQSSGD